ncbi:hypothetical protein MF672_039045 [Actinomadura sp. ATCC 31491]|uniref:Exonuclease domain-containing protein n=1 Tax=Actinomadura luzonensis TaxID=2805427 RepID=A0ABT0G573_9ACTN|nr:exonuclease domain-containing protein [Actinomadura luzonensis]MCK2219752.1 hypothetical protein [Actinomadura luzonensis]
MTPWPLSRLSAFDLETTGTDPEEALIVEAYLGYIGGGLATIDHKPLLAAVECPEEASKIHGYTSAYLAEHGQPAEVVVEHTAVRVAEAINQRVPLVGHNIVYDLTVLDRECRRHGYPTVEECTGGVIGPVIDTKLLSKQVDPWRRRVSEEQGAHALKTCAEVFKVEWSDDDAHGARYDALISARVAYKIGFYAFHPDKRPRLSGWKDERWRFDALAVDLPELFARQKQWAAEQALSYQEYLRSPKAKEQQDPNAVISTAWPVTPFADERAEAAR